MSAVPALASGSISALNVQNVVNDDTAQAVGTVKVVIPGGSLLLNKTLFVKLPDGFDFDGFDGVGTAIDSSVNMIAVPDTVSGDDNGLLAADFDATLNAADDEIAITVDADPADDVTFYIVMGQVIVSEDKTVTLLLILKPAQDSPLEMLL